MRDIIHAKADASPVFKQILLQSAGCRLVEAVKGDIFWSSALSPQYAATTKPEYFPGNNQLGNVLTLVREELMKEAVLAVELELDDSADDVPPNFLPYNLVPPMTDDGSDLPPPPTFLSPISDRNTSITDSVSSTSSHLYTPNTTIHSPCVKSPHVHSPSVHSPTVHVQSPTVHSPAVQSPTVHSPAVQSPIVHTPVTTSHTPRNITTLTAFDVLMKRKISPEKEADVTQENSKVARMDIIVA